MSADAEPVPVLLLKTKSSPNDGYDDYFSQAKSPTYTHHFVPVLEHSFNTQALDAVEAKIKAAAFTTAGGAADGYGGVIFTSQRAVEAFIEVVKRLRSQNVDLGSLLPASLPLYVVGPATARSLASLELQCPIIGEESGNGEALASFILQHYNGLHSPEPGKSKPALLFLVGEQRRDIIPRTLQNETLPSQDQINVNELTVYETVVMASFADDFRARLQAIPSSTPLVWVVVFSPTGCRAMLEILSMLDPATGKVSPSLQKSPRRTKIVTIGPTTRDYLIRNFDFSPDACASKPSPEGVASALQT